MSTTNTSGPVRVAARTLLACALSATMVAGGLPATALAEESARLAGGASEVTAEATAEATLQQSEQTFSDVPTTGPWYAESVYTAAGLGLFSGYDDGTFRPSATLTRAQAAVVLWNYLAASGDEEGYPSNQTGFSDVKSGTWYTAAANWAVANGIIAGKGDGSFDPNGALTREQLCTIIKRVADTYGTADLANTGLRLADMADQQNVSSWAQGSMDWCLRYGVLSGAKGSDGQLFAQGSGAVSRAMMAAIMINAIDAGVLPTSRSASQSANNSGSTTNSGSATGSASSSTGTASGTNADETSAAGESSCETSTSGSATENAAASGSDAATNDDEIDSEVVSDTIVDTSLSASRSATISEGWYTIANCDNGECLDVSGNSWDDCVNVQTWGSNGSAGQKWYIKKVGNYYTLQSGISYAAGCNKTLDCVNFKTSNGTNVQQYPYYGTANQKWTIKVNSDGSFTLQSGSSNAVLDVDDGKSHGNVQLWNSYGGDNQKWTLKSTSAPTTFYGSAVTISNGWYTIGATTNTNLCLDMTGYSLDEGTGAQTYTKYSTDNQTWYFEKVSGNYYRIESGVSGLVLGAADNGTTKGTRVVQQAYTGSSAQLWTIHQVNGKYVLRNKLSGLFMDITGGSASSCTPVELWEWSTGNAQKWTLTKNSGPTLQNAGLSSGWYTIQSFIDNEWLDAEGNSSEDCANVRIWEGTGLACQKWYIKNCGSYYTIQSGSSYAAGKTEVLDCVNFGTASGTNVQQYPDRGTTNQRWYIKKRANGVFVIQSVTSGKVLDVACSQKRGNVQLWDNNRTKNQSWRIVSTSAPAVNTLGNGTRGMSSEEYQTAVQIFNAYNDWRANHGLNRVTWSDKCCDMAYSGVQQCAWRDSLTHRLGIPTSLQTSYSDILAASDYQMSGSDAISAWENSYGHRAQMKCTTATEAAVACYYYDNGSNEYTWYYAIVYNFSGTNVCY